MTSTPKCRKSFFAAAVAVYVASNTVTRHVNGFDILSAKRLSRRAGERCVPLNFQESGSINDQSHWPLSSTTSSILPSPRLSDLSSNSPITTILPQIRGSDQKHSNLLTRDEEAKCSTEIVKFVSLVRVKEDYERAFGRVPTDEEWADSANLDLLNLRDQIKRSREARACLMNGNVGLVVSVAKKYKNRGLAFADLVQEGSLGLLEAAERFDPAKGFKFCTYATWWIRQRITRSIAEYSRVIRLPEHVHVTLGVMNRIKKDLTVELGRQPTKLEIASRMNIPLKKVQKLSESSKMVLSLEIPIGWKVDDRRTLRDGIASDSPTPEDHTESDLLRGEVISVMEDLAPTERDVLMMRFGLDDGTSKSIDEVAYRLKVTREKVRSVEARAINKLRHPIRNFRLKEYLQQGELLR